MLAAGGWGRGPALVMATGQWVGERGLGIVEGFIQKRKQRLSQLLGGHN